MAVPRAAQRLSNRDLLAAGQCRDARSRRPPDGGNPAISRRVLLRLETTAGRLQHQFAAQSLDIERDQQQVGEQRRRLRRRIVQLSANAFGQLITSAGRGLDRQRGERGQM
jgi:hypothetical protein